MGGNASSKQNTAFLEEVFVESEPFCLSDPKRPVRTIARTMGRQSGPAVAEKACVTPAVLKAGRTNRLGSLFSLISDITLLKYLQDPARKNRTG